MHRLMTQSSPEEAEQLVDMDRWGANCYYFETPRLG